MGKHMECIEVMHNGRLLLVNSQFELSEEGPTNLVVDGYYDLANAEPVIFSQKEFLAFRFSVADAVERKYWAGEYSSIRSV